MALVRLPEISCFHCKRPKALKYHDDGSIRSSYCHGCQNRPPGPAGYPQLFDKGKFRVEQTKEGLRVYSVQGRLESEVLRNAQARGIDPK